MDDTTKTVEAATKTTQDTVKEVSQFTTYLQNHIPDLISFGIKVVFALVFFFIGRIVIRWIRKLVRKSMQRSGADKGVEQFVDSLLKFSLYFLLLFMIGTIWNRCFFCSGIDCIRWCGNRPCHARKSFQLCGWCIDPSPEAI